MRADHTSTQRYSLIRGERCISSMSLARNTRARSPMSSPRARAARSSATGEVNPPVGRAFALLSTPVPHRPAIARSVAELSRLRQEAVSWNKAGDGTRPAWRAADLAVVGRWDDGRRGWKTCQTPYHVRHGHGGGLSVG